MRELSLHTASICAGVWDTKELCLLLCVMVGRLITREQYFWTYFGKYSAGKRYMECKLFPACLAFLKSLVLHKNTIF